MNLPALVLTITTIGLGSASVYLYTELDAARGRADAEAALRLEQEARVRTLEEMRLSLERQLQASSGAGWDMHDGVPSDAKTPPPGGAVTNTGETTNHEFERAFEGRNSFRNMINTPDGRKAMAAAQKMGLRAMYKDLAKELNLSNEQANELLDLLAQQQVDQMEKFRDARGDPAAMAQVNTDLERKNELELMTLLGDKYQKYENYQQSLGERMQVDQLGVQFAAANIPLADNQKKQLMTAMVEERKASAQPGWSQDSTPQENMARARKWQEDYTQRVRERVSGVLSAEQMAQYEEMQKAQSLPFGNVTAFGMNGRMMQFNGVIPIRRGGR